MGTYGLDIYSLSDVATNYPGIVSQTLNGQQWGWYFNPTLTVDSGATPIHVEVSDSDASPGNLGDDSTGQLLTTGATIGGTTYPAGTQLQDEYEVTLTDGHGNNYRFVAISTRTYFDPYTYADQIIGYTWEGPAPPAGATLSYVPNSAQDYASMTPCFAAGTLIETPAGPRPVEALRPGDAIRSPDGAAHAILWIGRRHLDRGRLDLAPNLRPIRIGAGALGPGLPDADLVVSPQHRLLVRSTIATRLCGAREVLVAAKHLLGLPGIALARDLGEVSYFHLLCAGHEILIANRVETESLYLGRYARQAFTRADWRELRALFPALAAAAMPAPAPARPLVTGRLGRKLAACHARHARALQ